LAAEEDYKETARSRRFSSRLDSFNNASNALYDELPDSENQN